MSVLSVGAMTSLSIGMRSGVCAHSASETSGSSYGVASGGNGMRRRAALINARTNRVTALNHTHTTTIRIKGIVILVQKETHANRLLIIGVRGNTRRRMHAI